jgi:prefoldin subunit 5
MIQQELVKAKHECEAVKAQFEKLNLRHSLLQHTLQLLDEQKGSEAKVEVFVLIHVSPASAGAIVRRVWSDVMS